MKRLHHLASVIALVAALAGVVGHVCVVPVSAATLHGDHGQREDTAAEAHPVEARDVHVASCEVTPVAPPAPSVPCVVMSWASTLAPMALRATVSRPVLAEASGPPLYVVHAALLI